MVEKVSGRSEQLSLDGVHIFLTGATGFVGQAVLERLLSSHPGSRISILVRRKGAAPVENRVTQLLRKPVFRPWIESVGEAAAREIFDARVQVVSGSLTAMPELPDDIDVVIHSASTVSFDPPIDEAFATNVGGARSLYDALLVSRSDPHVVHVSTAYVGGIRKGIHPEKQLAHEVDWRIEAEAAQSARQRVEDESREPEALTRFLDAARARSGKAGPQAVAAEAEAARIAWVRSRLVDFGRLRAESLGWTDVYTLTKAFAERVAEELWAGTGHRLSVVRPSIIESALRHPYPGWIDGFKVADPLILAYGRGLLPDFPALPDSVLDIIPVDHVVNALLAAAATDAEPEAARYFHITSGASNPLPFHVMYENVHEYFTAHPISKGDGEIAAPTWRFPGVSKVEHELVKRERQVARVERIVSRLPRGPRTRRRLDEIKARRNDLETLRGYTDLYRAYVQTEIIFADDNARTLAEAVPAGERAESGFDVSAIDWHDYLQHVHFPAVMALTRAFADRPAATRRAARALPVRSDVVAVFDLEGTVVASNLIEQYLLLWAGSVPRRRIAHDLADFALSLPAYYRAERRDRGDFIRTFMRRYEGFRVADLENLARGGFRRAMLRRTYPDALARAAAHRAAGHRTILVTGSMDLAVAPFVPFFDEVVAGRVHERDGILTGYLADPPLVDEARAAWLRAYAERNGFDLAHSYGYGDSHSDIPWLQLTGHAHAVNPDPALHRFSQDRQWTILEWHRGGASEPVVPPARLEPRTDAAEGTAAG
jgi:alcohol-forming fatty acyl-CoA reductase